MIKLPYNPHFPFFLSSGKFTVGLVIPLKYFTNCACTSTSDLEGFIYFSLLQFHSLEEVLFTTSLRNPFSWAAGPAGCGSSSETLCCSRMLSEAHPGSSMRLFNNREYKCSAHHVPDTILSISHAFISQHCYLHALCPLGISFLIFKM